MAEHYLAHAEDRYTLYRLCPDVAQSVEEAKRALNVIAYVFYGKVHNLILCKLPFLAHTASIFLLFSRTLTETP
jgi:hypothetical protein